MKHLLLRAILKFCTNKKLFYNKVFSFSHKDNCNKCEEMKLKEITKDRQSVSRFAKILLSSCN